MYSQVPKQSRIQVILSNNLNLKFIGIITNKFYDKKNMIKKMDGWMDGWMDGRMDGWIDI